MRFLNRKHNKNKRRHYTNTVILLDGSPSMADMMEGASKLEQMNKVTVGTTMTMFKNPDVQDRIELISFNLSCTTLFKMANPLHRRDSLSFIMKKLASVQP